MENYLRDCCLGNNINIKNFYTGMCIRNIITSKMLLFLATYASPNRHGFLLSIWIKVLNVIICK